jgi:hypothetical protein
MNMSWIVKTQIGRPGANRSTRQANVAPMVNQMALGAVCGDARVVCPVAEIVGNVAFCLAAREPVTPWQGSR